MAEAKLALNLLRWRIEHSSRYLSSGGADGHLYKMTRPGGPGSVRGRGGNSGSGMCC